MGENQPPESSGAFNDISILEYPSTRHLGEYSQTAAGQASGIFPTYMQVKIPPSLFIIFAGIDEEVVV